MAVFPRNSFLFLLVFVWIGGSSLHAQSAALDDDGTPALSISSGGGLAATRGSGCTASWLGTTFVSNNGHSGNMFDVTPNYNMYFRCMDINTSTSAGNTITVEFWYMNGSCRNNATNSAPWTQLLVTTAVSAGRDNPTRVDLSGMDFVFEAGQEYGIAVFFPSCRYTNGAGGSNSGTDWVNSDLTLTTYYGIGSLFSSFFTPRDWNGNLYYEPAIPTVAVENLVGGGLATFRMSGMTPDNGAFFIMSTTGYGSSATPFGIFDLAAPLIPLPPPPLPLLVDANGETSLSMMVPPTASGRTIYFQGVELTPTERRRSDPMDSTVL
jgi:hypothetical protein